MITIHDVEQGSDEWLKLRDQLYTGSNADKLLLHNGKTKVVNGVVSKYSLTEITGFKGNFYTKRGHALEEEAVEIYEAHTGRTVARPGFITNSKYPVCGYSPDGIDGDTLLEVKAFNDIKHDVINKDNIPLKILAQIIFGLVISEKTDAFLLLYNPRFAKKFLDDVENPHYNPRNAFKMIEVKASRDALINMRKILREASL